MKQIVDYDMCVLYNRDMKYLCDRCHSEYQECPSHHAKTKNHYCSSDCYWESKKKRVIRKCIECNNSFDLTPSRVLQGAGKFCSEICRRKYDKEHKMTRKEIWTRYNASKKAIKHKRVWHEKKWFGNSNLLNDNSECIICKSKKNLLIHHIDGNNGRHGKLLNNRESNFAILCRKCHPKYHNRWGIKEVVSYEVTN